jgi:hypothetical protein
LYGKQTKSLRLKPLLSSATIPDKDSKILFFDLRSCAANLS